jgi:hypothetical protein
MIDDTQLEHVSVVRANCVVGICVRVHWLAMRGMWWSGFGMAVASGTRINRPLARDTIYSVQVIYFGKPVTCTYICRTNMDVILFQLKKCTQYS